ncbi:MAG TPA: non-homologous end-joining DNA ligase [Verrucomicrobiae bacterium]|jgi:bifunctional non-homologous end joining protein LigD|nr:non-homologous end-joining DNA ligase [Verrucomicrobiae bacterium]
MSLKEYNKKRDFAKTREPPPAKPSNGKGHHFVIQKHAASRLHYDFRLEIDGTLKSWAVPKGIPVVKGEKRLAVHVEDHPVSYMDFEGVIPKGQYGGGTVMVWDIGTFEPLGPTDVDSGKLHFVLNGKKLKGEWRLVRMRDGDQWLLIRGGDDMRPISKKMDDTSALSGKSMKELAGNGRVWESNRRQSSQPAKAAAPKPAKFTEPMKARLVESPPAGDWIYEIKFDGFRALAFKKNEVVSLFSRNEKDFGDKFSEVRDAVAQLDVEDAIIDGEIVALDDKGRSSFQLLQQFEMGEERPPLFFYAFDLLRLDGKDLTRQPLLKRKSQLEQILKNAPDAIRYSSSLGNEAKPLLAKVRKLGLEGLIGKRADSLYEAGRRSGAWIKLKLHQEQEMVIGGYSDPEGSRTHFGSLLIGFYEGEKLKFAGKVGTGFTEAILESVHSQLKKIAVDKCPFANLPERKNGRYGKNITAAEMKRCHWVRPVLVCQVKYSEWTQDGKLRQPVYLGLREDKDANDVVRERAAQP